MGFASWTRLPEPRTVQERGPASEAEWRHLQDLVQRGRTLADWCDPCLPDGARFLLDDQTTSPAYVIARAYDPLGWNADMCALFGDPVQRPTRPADRSSRLERGLLLAEPGYRAGP